MKKCETIKDSAWKKAIQLAQALIKIKSVSGHPDNEAILHFVQDELKGIPCRIVRPQSAPPYLISTLDPNANPDDPNLHFGKRPLFSKSDTPSFTLILSGHLDTVSVEGMVDPFTPIVKDGSLFGRGAVDMKGGCAALMTAFKAFESVGKRTGEVHLILTLDEETGSASASHAIANELPRGDLAIIGEPTKLDFITSHKGCHWIDVTFYGKSCHASMPHEGRNAISMASDFIHCMNLYTQTHFPHRRHPSCGLPTLSVGNIQGGGPCVNIVPDRCSVTIDRRWTPNESIDLVHDDFQKIITICNTLNPDFHAALSVEDPRTVPLYPPLDFTQQKNLLERLTDAVGAAGLTDVKETFFSGWTEGALFEAAGTPALVFGPGDFTTAHTIDEHVEMDQIVQSAKAYFSILSHFCAGLS